jgi:hypothetical protein
MQVPIWFGYLSIFVDAGEILVMADDVATPLNPPVALVEQEELEEAPLDVNVSVATPFWAKCEGEAHTPKSGKLELTHP